MRRTCIRLAIACPSESRRSPGIFPNDLVLWVESRRALVAGDTLIDRGNGLELPVDWLSEEVTREQMLAVLRPLLELPVELVLPTHGAPTDRAAPRARALLTHEAGSPLEVDPHHDPA
ncbi:MAG: hypothetical protein ACRDNY_13540 [Gaiellaceae bacterium]